MRKVTVAVVQMNCTGLPSQNLQKACDMVRSAAKNGANVILLPELFETRYFCQERNYDLYSLASTLDASPVVSKLRLLADELNVVIPVSFFERSGNTFFNTVAMIDAGGNILGVYRKTHIPDDHFYQEKFYFTPGDTGFKVWDTKFGKIGVGICWDQWFPEAARCMALNGAELLLYPTAIGSEPILECDSMPHWQRCMQGHSAANLVPVAAANRIGIEKVFPTPENQNQSSSLLFYGSSFLTNNTGEIICSASRDREEVLTAEYDLDALYNFRTSWGVFRDRRPECYSRMMGH